MTTMNNKIKILFIFLLATFVSCSKEDMMDYKLDGYDKVYPIFVVNEGKYNVTDVGSVGKYSSTEGKYIPSVCGGLDNFGLGGTPSFATVWIDTVYVVSKDNNKGNVLAAYDKKTGDFVRGYKSEAGVQGSSFIVINNKYGVLTTNGGGAIVLDMATLQSIGTLKSTSTYTGDLAIAGGNLYVIDNQKTLLAYPLDGILTAEPKNLGPAIGGFVESKDGFLWAYDNESTINADWEWDVVNKTFLLKIDAVNATIVDRQELPLAMLPSLFSYRPGLMTASMADNSIFFFESSEVENSKIYKYHINEDRVEELYVADGYSIINILYNSSNGSLMALTRKLLQYVDYGIIAIDARSGKLRGTRTPINSDDSNSIPTFMLLDKTE